MFVSIRILNHFTSSLFSYFLHLSRLPYNISRFFHKQTFQDASFCTRQEPRLYLVYTHFVTWSSVLLISCACESVHSQHHRFSWDSAAEFHLFSRVHSFSCNRTMYRYSNCLEQFQWLNYLLLFVDSFYSFKWNGYKCNYSFYLWYLRISTNPAAVCVLVCLS